LLTRFLPDGAEESAEQYEVPQYSDQPHQVFSDADSLMDYMEVHPTVPHSIYWRSRKESDSTQVNVHYTNYGAMVLGVACPADTKEDQLLAVLKREFDAQYGYIAYESPPPESEVEFIEVAGKSSEPIGQPDW
jgi:hypothetical protein